MYAQLARPGAKQIPVNSDDVPDVDLLVQLVIAFGDAILTNVHLQPLAILLQMREPGLAHAADRHHPPRDPDVNARLELLRGLVAVLRQDTRNRVSEIETAPVRIEPQRPNLLNPLDALLVQIVFERH